MAQHLRVDLASLTAMQYTVASLRCVPQSMQGVHRVIQSLFLFDVVSGYVKQLPWPYHKCFLCLRNAVWESGLINLKDGGLVQIPPRSAAQRFRAACIHNSLFRLAGRSESGRTVPNAFAGAVNASSLQPLETMAAVIPTGK